MSFRIHVLGLRQAQIVRRERPEFVEEGCYFDDPVFAPDPSSPEAAEPASARFDIFEHAGSSPVVTRLAVSCRG